MQLTPHTCSAPAVKVLMAFTYAGSASCASSGAGSDDDDGDGGANSATAAAAAISASFLLTTTDNRSSRGSNRYICITFSSCGQFSSHRIECWRGPSLKL